MQRQAIGRDFSLHAGQKAALASRANFILVLAGWQSGKTVIGPHWLLHEIHRKGPGDYLIGTPNFSLADKKVLPEFLRLFHDGLQLGDTNLGRRGYHGTRHVFTLSAEGAYRIFKEEPDVPTQIFFAHADDPGSLESATYKGAWLDEAGHPKFKAQSWDVIRSRLHINKGRALLTTRPYDLGWLKQILWDSWDKARQEKRRHPNIDVISFRSCDNPAFSRDVYEAMRLELPDWKFAMLYDGLFTRPAGSIYDCFEEKIHVVPKFEIPSTWPRWLGLDFGHVHTAGVFLAEECTDIGGRTGRVFAYRVYGPTGGAEAKQHKAALLAGEPCIPIAVGGVPGNGPDGQWRDDFARAGLGVREPPVKDVELGINRVYAALKKNELLILADDGLGERGNNTQKLIDNLKMYSRELDDMGEPTEAIKDKASWHLCDALRYVVADLKSGSGEWVLGPEDRQSSLVRAAPAGVFMEDFPTNW